MKNLLSKLLFTSALTCLIFTHSILAEEICPLVNPAKPKEVKSLQAIKNIAVLQDGRVKPLETYAQNILLQFSGKKQFDQKPALHWFAKLLFAPQTTANDKIFLINNPEIPMALGVEPDEKRRYSFAVLKDKYDKLHELALKANDIDKKSRTIVDEEILRVESNLRFYSDLSITLAYAFPDESFSVENPETAKSFELPQGQKQFSFLDLALKADLIQKAMTQVRAKSKAQWTDQDKEVVKLVTNLFEWSSYYKDLPVQIIPLDNAKTESWLSPWDAINDQFQDERSRREVLLLKDLAQAYWDGKQLEFDMAARGFTDSIASRDVKSIRKSLKKVPIELIYNNLNLLLWTKMLYGLGLTLFFLSLFSDKFILYRVGWFSVVFGFMAHTVAIILRIVILSRPPVSNLYETFIFVGFVNVLVGIIIELSNRKWLGIVVGSVGGFILLTIAGKFSADGDTMQMLVAVLNSNFWLGTHVLSITIGYAGVCAAGILGHVYLLQSIFKPREKALIDSIYRNILGVLGFGLTMTFLGTNLGGIWADQSWGRFWGWDPKENGAMLIVLWCAIIFHLRVGKMIGPLGVAVGSVLGIIIVAWAWFGVNLLSVGLHSYGFTAGAATGLITYAGLEILFAVISVWLIKKRVSFSPSQLPSSSNK